MNIQYSNIIMYYVFSSLLEKVNATLHLILSSNYYSLQVDISNPLKRLNSSAMMIQCREMRKKQFTFPSNIVTHVFCCYDKAVGLNVRFSLLPA